MGKCGIVCVILISIVTFCTELVFSCLVGYHIYNTNDIILFAIIVGLLVLVSIVVQLLSWQLQSLRDTKDRSKTGDAIVLFLHVFQLGLLWRYIRILTVQKLTLSRKELWETFMLRTLHSLCCSIPILLLLSYIVLKEQSLARDWYIIAAISTSLVSCAWGIATFRKHQDYCCVVGAVCPGLALFLKAGWRLGEVMCRVLTLVMFIQVQGYWVFLVVGGHWITMLVLISVEAALQDSQSNIKQNMATCKTVSGVAVKSYAYIFCYLNPAGEKSRFGTAVYYVITCLESIALLALWIIYEPRKELHIPLALVASISCAVGLSFGALYYSCFHRSGVAHADNPIDTACLTECIDCHRSSCGFSQPSSQQSSFEPNWEQYIDHHAAAVSAANRVEEQSHMCHNEHIPEKTKREYHNVLLNRYNDKKRSETPLVLMGYEREAPVKERGINHSRANSLDFLWDNYDLQLRDHVHGIENVELEEFQPPGISYCRKKCRPNGTSGTDQGYYSGISSSSKENTRNKAAMNAILERDPIQHLQELQYNAKPLHRLHCRARDGGTTSDGNTSSYSTTSSKRAMVNCGKCGNSLSVDSTSIAPSMYSLASSTSFASSAAPYYHPRRRASIHVMDRGYYNRRKQRRRRLMEQPMFGAEGSETLEQAVARIHGAVGLAHRHSIMSSDVTSSAWDYTDSEI